MSTIDAMNRIASSLSGIGETLLRLARIMTESFEGLFRGLFRAARAFHLGHGKAPAPLPPRIVRYGHAIARGKRFRGARKTSRAWRRYWRAVRAW